MVLEWAPSPPSKWEKRHAKWQKRARIDEKKLKDPIYSLMYLVDVSVRDAKKRKAARISDLMLAGQGPPEDDYSSSESEDEMVEEEDTIPTKVAAKPKAASISHEPMDPSPTDSSNSNSNNNDYKSGAKMTTEDEEAARQKLKDTISYLLRLLEGEDDQDDCASADTKSSLLPLLKYVGDLSVEYLSAVSTKLDGIVPIVRRRWIQKQNGKRVFLLVGKEGDDSVKVYDVTSTETHSSAAPFFVHLTSQWKVMPMLPMGPPVEYVFEISTAAAVHWFSYIPSDREARKMKRDFEKTGSSDPKSTGADGLGVTGGSIKGMNNRLLPSKSDETEMSNKRPRLHDVETTATTAAREGKDDSVAAVVPILLHSGFLEIPTLGRFVFQTSRTIREAARTNAADANDNDDDVVWLALCHLHWGIERTKERLAVTFWTAKRCFESHFLPPAECPNKYMLRPLKYTPENYALEVNIYPSVDPDRDDIQNIAAQNNTSRVSFSLPGHAVARFLDKGSLPYGQLPKCVLLPCCASNKFSVNIVLMLLKPNNLHQPPIELLNQWQVWDGICKEKVELHSRQGEVQTIERPKIEKYIPDDQRKPRWEKFGYAGWLSKDIRRAWEGIHAKAVLKYEHTNNKGRVAIQGISLECGRVTEILKLRRGVQLAHLLEALPQVVDADFPYAQPRPLKYTPSDYVLMIDMVPSRPNIPRQRWERPLVTLALAGGKIPQFFETGKVELKLDLDQQAVDTPPTMWHAKVSLLLKPRQIVVDLVDKLIRNSDCERFGRYIVPFVLDGCKLPLPYCGYGGWLRSQLRTSTRALRATVGTGHRPIPKSPKSDLTGVSLEYGVDLEKSPNITFAHLLEALPIFQDDD